VATRNTLLEQEILSQHTFFELLRTYLRDTPELNTLVDGIEYSNAMFLVTLMLVLDDINASPPPLGMFLTRDVPSGILLDGVVYRLLSSAAILYARNAISFMSGTTTVQLDQYRIYLQMAADYRSAYKESLNQWKISLNHQMALDAVGGVHSDWLWVNSPSRFFLQNAPSGFYR